MLRTFNSGQFKKYKWAIFIIIFQRRRKQMHKVTSCSSSHNSPVGPEREATTKELSSLTTGIVRAPEISVSFVNEWAQLWHGCSHLSVSHVSVTSISWAVLTYSNDILPQLHSNGTLSAFILCFVSPTFTDSSLCKFRDWNKNLSSK